MPIITISRGSLSGGQAVADCLSAKLGFPCVAREILQEAARKVGASEEDLNSKLEEPPRRWPHLIRERRFYLLAVAAALAERCARGSLVYHGLAGQFLLRGIPEVLKVRLIAPLDMRINALTSAHHGMGRKAAKEFIHNVDEDRRRWVKMMYHEDVRDTRLYDLTLNLQNITVEIACEIITEAAREYPAQLTDRAVLALQDLAAKCQEKLPPPESGR